MAEQQFHKIDDLSKEQLVGLRSRNVVGCDPGKKSMVYMVDDNGNKLQYTALQRRVESYAKRNQRILLQMKSRHTIEVMEASVTEQNSERQTIKDIEASVAEQNSKSIKVEVFREYLKKKTQLNRSVGDFYEKEVWRKKKFVQHSYAKKIIERFLNKIEDTYSYCVWRLE